MDSDNFVWRFWAIVAKPMEVDLLGKISSGFLAVAVLMGEIRNRGSYCCV
jgi:hypothetical protein